MCKTAIGMCELFKNMFLSVVHDDQPKLLVQMQNMPLRS